MFDEKRDLFLRGLSLFHGWLPFLLFYLVRRLGYDRRALVVWSVICVALCLIAYFLLPPAGAVLADPKIPRNVNYVFGILSDDKPQEWMAPLAYLGAWMAVLIGIAATPVHFVLGKICQPAR